MADPILIRPKDLEPRENPVASEVLAVDNGENVRKINLTQLVDAGRPLASQAEAETGIQATKAMTPLTTRQAVTARIGVDIASKSQGDKADTALQSIVAGENVEVDTADPLRPVINSTGGLSDDSVTEPKLAAGLAVKLSRFVPDRAALEDADGARSPLVLQGGENGGEFVWDGANQSANIVTHTTVFLSANPANAEIIMPGFTSISVASNTLTFAAPHGIQVGTRLTPQNSVNTLSIGGDYYAIVPSPTTLKLAPNAVAAAAGQALAFGSTTQVMTLRRVHEFQTGDAVFSDTAINGLPANTLAYVIVIAAYYIKLAATYDDAVAAVPVPLNLTGTAAMTLRKVSDPAQAVYVTKAGELPSGVSGAFVRTGERFTTPYQHGATGRGLVDDAPAFQRALSYAFEHSLPLIIEPGEFLFDSECRLITTRTFHTSNRLGVHIEAKGPQNTLLKQSPASPANRPFFNFDSNPFNISDQNIGVTQGPHFIGGFRMEGKGYNPLLPTMGIRWRGVDGITLEDLEFFGFGGDALHMAGTTVASKDDADTSSLILLQNVRIEQVAGYGFYGADSRSGSVEISTCLFQRTDKGNVVSPAGCVIQNNIFNLIGNAANPTAAGLSISQSITDAEARAIVIQGNMFESCYKYALKLERASGAVVEGNAFHPFTSSATDQVSLDIGSTSATGVVIQANRWQPISGAPSTIPYVNFRAGCDDIHLIGNSVTDEFGSQARVKHASATNIYKNYVAI